LQLPRALTRGEAPGLGISKYTLLQSFQYKNELLLLSELKKISVILASIALAFVHHSYVATDMCKKVGMKSFSKFLTPTPLPSAFQQNAYEGDF
jgi:hypothetical protein